MVVSTCPFVDAVRAAWKALDGGLSAIDAVVEGCSACEELRCDGTVGPGGSTDENGETTLDALVMDGATTEVGAVAAMRYVKDGIKAARLVMQYMEHTLLGGEQASVFAISMGLPGPVNLSSEDSVQKWIKWKENGCQPNFQKNVLPTNSCGPYHPKEESNFAKTSCSIVNVMEITTTFVPQINVHNHDTIAMAVIDKMGHIAVGTFHQWSNLQDPRQLSNCGEYEARNGAQACCRGCYVPDCNKVSKFCCSCFCCEQGWHTCRCLPWMYVTVLCQNSEHGRYGGVHRHTSDWKLLYFKNLKC